LPIDKSFQRTWQIHGTHNGHKIWKCASSKLGIHGTRVAVDLDVCTGCSKCLIVCPVDVFAKWTPTKHQVRIDPAGEDNCLECLACEIVCPVDAILIARTSSDDDTLNALLQ
jgi:NAD-dependent dihydropyrimidine dehydrogenase PreA subunit